MSSDTNKGKDLIEPNPMTMTGYQCITKGYFFNVKINHKDITTPLIVVHSNQNCFITINNVNSLFNHLKISNFLGANLKGSKNNKKSDLKDVNLFDINVKDDNYYNFEELMFNNKIRRKLMVINGSHNVLDDLASPVKKIMYSYIDFLFSNLSFGKS